jgi:hypothetical protein
MTSDVVTMELHRPAAESSPEMINLFPARDLSTDNVTMTPQTDKESFR